MSLFGTALHAFKWSLMGEMATRVVGPVVFIVLARILLPEDFGVVAAATVAISFSQIFWDSGLARALIQREGDDSTLANMVFWINLGLSIVVTLAMWLLAPGVAMYFNDSRIAEVLRVLASQAPLAATSAVLIALMQKRFEFRRLFWVRLVTTGVPGLASIPLALAGWSYWALVTGVLLGQLLQTLALWHQAGWRPHWVMDWSSVSGLLSFSGWTVASGLAGWLYSWLDTIVVGRFLGAHDMGLYRTGNTFVILILGTIFSPLLPVLYSLFSRAQHDKDRLHDGLMTIAHAIALISLPVGMGLLVLRNELGALVFGSHWIGVGVVIGLLGLTHSLGWIVGANGELYRAIGKPHVETLIMAAMLIIYLPAYLVAIRGGINTFLWARLGCGALALVGHVLVCWRVTAISPVRWIRACGWALVAGTGTAILVHWAALLLPNTWWRTAAMFLFGLTVYGLSIAVLERAFIARLLALFGTREGTVRPLKSPNANTG